ncbi:MAG: hypothetical protein HYY06_23155 [Deltaproteobacteria bacterium]|nr:hypothetical protein [Deltaproteobacteria bacterium]
MRVRLAFLCSLVLAPACGGDIGEYSVVVRVPGGSERAARLELSVLESCAEVPDPGDDPADVLRQVWAFGGEAESLGKLAEGRYGLYGRAWDGECFLYAAGCDAFVIEGGGEGTVEVILGELDEPRGCAAGMSCEQGECREAGAGVCEGTAELCVELWCGGCDSDDACARCACEQGCYEQCPEQGPEC